MSAPNGHFTRRRLIELIGLGMAGLLAACAAPPPTQAPAPAPTKPAAPAPPPATAEAKPTAPPTESAERTAAKAPAQAASPAATQAPPKPATLAKLRFGQTTPAVNTSTESVAAERGFFKDAGVDVNIQRLNNDIQILQAIISGELDAGQMGPSAALISVENGNDIKIVSTDILRSTFIMYSKKDIASPKDLAGKNIGITAPNALPHVLAQALLIGAGVDPKTANYVQFQVPTASIQALVAGSIDATPARVDFLQQVEQAGTLKVLAPLGEALPNFIQQSHVVSDKFIRDNPNALTRFIVGDLKSVRFMQSNKAETVPLLAKVTGLKPEEVAFLYDWFIKNQAWNLNLLIRPESLQWMQDIAVQLGIQKQVLPPDKVFAPQFQRQAVAEVGEAR